MNGRPSRLVWTVLFLGVSPIWIVACSATPEPTTVRPTESPATATVAERIETAVPTEAGLIVNPKTFIACVKDPDILSTLHAQANSDKGHILSELSREMNEKVAQLDMDNATREDVIRVFGQPQSYQGKGQTFEEENLPDRYVMVYADRFSVSMFNDRIEHVLFWKPGYVFRDRITVGSTLEEFLSVLGPQTKTIDGGAYKLERGVLSTHEGETVEPENGVLYKDIGNRKGFCYYDTRAFQRVRLLFMGNRVVAISITRKGK